MCIILLLTSVTDLILDGKRRGLLHKLIVLGIGK